MIGFPIKNLSSVALPLADSNRRRGRSRETIASRDSYYGPTGKLLSSGSFAQSEGFRHGAAPPQGPVRRVGQCQAPK